MLAKIRLIDSIIRPTSHLSAIASVLSNLPIRRLTECREIRGSFVVQMIIKELSMMYFVVVRRSVRW